LFGRSMEEVAVPTADGAADGDHYSVLRRMVTTVSQDHAQLRTLVYEFARRKLRRNLYQQFEDGDWSGVQEQMRALEAAIAQVEVDCARNALSFSPEPPLTDLSSNDAALGMRPAANKVVTIGNRGRSAPLRSARTYDLRPASALRSASFSDTFLAVARPNKPSRSDFWWKVQLSAAVLLGVIIYAAVDPESVLGRLGLHRLEAPPNVGAASASASIRNRDAVPTEKPSDNKVARSSAPGIPLPVEYGTYVLSNGQLTELDLLPIRVPDQRVAISPLISAPSKTHLPAGKLEFIIFRRDLANSAPDRVMVRVVAQIVRALKFDPAGKAITSKVEDAWVVRSNSYQMRVAPIAGNPEMILIRPDPPDFAFSPGRYALVLKGAAYDFTLDGVLTDAAHCLERTDALDLPVYTECRSL
jgi:hypothetical protein